MAENMENNVIGSLTMVLDYDRKQSSENALKTLEQNLKDMQKVLDEKLLTLNLSPDQNKLVKDVINSLTGMKGEVEKVAGALGESIGGAIGNGIDFTEDIKKINKLFETFAKRVDGLEDKIGNIKAPLDDIAASIAKMSASMETLNNNFKSTTFVDSAKAVTEATEETAKASKKTAKVVEQTADVVGNLKQNIDKTKNSLTEVVTALDKMKLAGEDVTNPTEWNKQVQSANRYRESLTSLVKQYEGFMGEGVPEFDQKYTKDVNAALVKLKAFNDEIRKAKQQANGATSIESKSEVPQSKKVPKDLVDNYVQSKKAVEDLQNQLMTLDKLNRAVDAGLNKKFAGSTISITKLKEQMTQIVDVQKELGSIADNPTADNYEELRTKLVSLKQDFLSMLKAYEKYISDKPTKTKVEDIKLKDGTLATDLAQEASTGIDNIREKSTIIARKLSKVQDDLRIDSERLAKASGMEAEEYIKSISAVEAVIETKEKLNAVNDSANAVSSTSIDTQIEEQNSLQRELQETIDKINELNKLTLKEYTTTKSGRKLKANDLYTEARLSGSQYVHEKINNNKEDAKALKDMVMYYKEYLNLQGKKKLLIDDPDGGQPFDLSDTYAQNYKAFVQEYETSKKLLAKKKAEIPALEQKKLLLEEQIEIQKQLNDVEKANNVVSTVETDKQAEALKEVAQVSESATQSMVEDQKDLQKEIAETIRTINMEIESLRLLGRSILSDTKPEKKGKKAAQQTLERIGEQILSKAKQQGVPWEEVKSENFDKERLQKSFIESFRNARESGVSVFTTDKWRDMYNAFIMDLEINNEKLKEALATREKILEDSKNQLEQKLSGIVTQQSSTQPQIQQEQLLESAIAATNEERKEAIALEQTLNSVETQVTKPVDTVNKTTSITSAQIASSEELTQLSQEDALVKTITASVNELKDAFISKTNQIKIEQIAMDTAARAEVAALNTIIKKVNELKEGLTEIGSMKINADVKVSEGGQGAPKEGKKLSDEEIAKLEKQKLLYKQLQTELSTYQSLKVKALKNKDESMAASLEKDANAAYFKIAKTLQQIQEENLEDKHKELGVTKKIAITEATINAQMAEKNKRLEETVRLAEQAKTASEETTQPADLSVAQKKRLTNLSNTTTLANGVSVIRNNLGDENKIAQYENAVKAVNDEFELLNQSIAKLQQASDKTFDELANDVATHKKKLQTLQTEALSQRYNKSNSGGSFDGDIIDIDTGKIGAGAKEVSRHLRTMLSGLGAVSVETTKFNIGTGKLEATLRTKEKTLQKVTLAYDKQTGATRLAYGAEEEYIGAIRKWTNGFSIKMRQIIQYVSAITIFTKSMRMLKQGAVIVREIDDALTDLKKTSEATEAQYKSFIKTSTQIAKSIGSTTSEIIKSAAAWSRLGYSLQETAELSKNVSLYLNVSEIEDVSVATEHMISTLKAYNIEARDSINIVDKFNQVGNNFAISSEGIGEALTRSAASLVAAGNSLDQSIGLITAGNIISQDPESVGNALKVLSLRIRGKIVPPYTVMYLRALCA